MFFYKKAYNFIALAVFVVGLAITPFIKFIVGEITIDINIYLVYIYILIVIGIYSSEFITQDYLSTIWQ